MQYFGQKTRQPCPPPPPPACQPTTGVKGAPGRVPQCGPPSYPPQRRQTCPPQPFTPPECVQPCPAQRQPAYVPRCPPQSCDPQARPPPPQQGYAPQRIQAYPSQASYGSSQGFQPPCKSGPTGYPKACASSYAPRCSPKGQGYAPQQSLPPCPQQGAVKGSQPWRSEPCIPKGGQACANQPCATPGGPACAVKGGQQRAKKHAVDTGNQVCIMKCVQQHSGQAGVTKGGPVCATKGGQRKAACVTKGVPPCVVAGNQYASQPCVAKGGRKGGRKSGSYRKSDELKLSTSGQFYRSADNWFFN